MRWTDTRTCDYSRPCNPDCRLQIWLLLLFCKYLCVSLTLHMLFPALNSSTTSPENPLRVSEDSAQTPPAHNLNESLQASFWGIPWGPECDAYWQSSGSVISMRFDTSAPNNFQLPKIKASTGSQLWTHLGPNVSTRPALAVTLAVCA